MRKILFQFQHFQLLIYYFKQLGGHPSDWSRKFKTLMVLDSKFPFLQTRNSLWNKLLSILHLTNFHSLLKCQEEISIMSSEFSISQSLKRIWKCFYLVWQTLIFPLKHLIWANCLKMKILFEMVDWVYPPLVVISAFNSLAPLSKSPDCEAQIQMVLFGWAWKH